MQYADLANSFFEVIENKLMKLFCVLLLVPLSLAYTGPYSPVCASVFEGISK